jgi:hypothetical protein
MIQIRISDISDPQARHLDLDASTDNCCYMPADGVFVIRSSEWSCREDKSNISFCDYPADCTLYLFVGKTLIACKGATPVEQAHLKEIYEILSVIERIPSYLATSNHEATGSAEAPSQSAGSIQSSTPVNSRNDAKTVTPAPLADEFVQIAKVGHAFQSKDVLQAIVEKERRRIKDEQIAWRIGGAIVGGLLGLQDGFDVSDIFTSLVFSNIGAVGHEVASREQLEFLQKCQAAWLVTQGSPLELASRIGPAKSRIIAFGEGLETPLIYNHHQGHRGDYLVPLGLACQHAKGFLEEGSRQAMINTFEEKDYTTLSNQLYPVPDNAIRLDSIRKITKEKAIELDPYAGSFVSQAEPVVIEVEGQQAVAYRVPIPIHSDY